MYMLDLSNARLPPILHAGLSFRGQQEEMRMRMRIVRGLGDRMFAGRRSNRAGPPALSVWPYVWLTLQGKKPISRLNIRALW